jgi:hypothetical protein
MTATLTRQIGNPLSTGDRMNNPPAESGTKQHDRELQLLVLEIQASTDRRDRVVRKQIDRLLKEISVRLNPTKRKLISQWLRIPNVESIVAEAERITLMEAVKKIVGYDLDKEGKKIPVYNPDKHGEKNPIYDPNKSTVMTWVKLILDSRFKDLLRKYRVSHKSISIDNPDAMAEAEIAKISEPEPEPMSSKLRRFIETDPDGHLAATHLRNQPLASLQKILLMRLDGRKWQEIADRLNITSHSTINNFHDKQLRKWNDYFRKYLCD